MSLPRRIRSRTVGFLHCQLSEVDNYVRVSICCASETHGELHRCVLLASCQSHLGVEESPQPLTQLFSPTINQHDKVFIHLNIIL